MKLAYQHEIDTSSVVETNDVIGREYFKAEAEALLELANSTTDPRAAACLIEKAGDLIALIDELSAAPHPGLQEPNPDAS